MKTKDFYYDLPEELIAQHAAMPRDSARMLVANRDSDEFQHKHFYDVVDYFKSGDVLVINNTKVIKARLFGNIEDRVVKVEFLLLKRINLTDWEVICKPARKLKVGIIVKFADNLKAEVIGIGDQGIRIVRFIFDGVFEEILNELGHVPLPPYITAELKDESRYQTVYSKIEGSAAAPTAGLHFTNEIFDKLKAKGVEIVEVLLHVGLSTFRPVKVDKIEDHDMHNEFYSVSQESADKINKAKEEGRRVICVGTTSIRTLESAYSDGKVQAGEGNTEIFIYPGYEFKVVDAIITNFHLPESTLIMLVSAFLGHKKTMEMYKIAVGEKYRFFSFGDATLLL